jgi:Domain of unknown function (DUF3385)
VSAVPSTRRRSLAHSHDPPWRVGRCQQGRAYACGKSSGTGSSILAFACQTAGTCRFGRLDRPLNSRRHMLFPAGAVLEEEAAEEVLPAAGLVTASADYYPTVAINALMRTLRDPVMAPHHAEVVRALFYIFTVRPSRIADMTAVQRPSSRAGSSESISSLPRYIACCFFPAGARPQLSAVPAKGAPGCSSGTAAV